MARFEQYGRPNGLPGVQEQGGMEPHAALEVLNRPDGTQVIGKKEIQEAAQILTRYKDGKANFERRIVEDELWWELRHWEVVRKARDKDHPTPDPSSAWLFNAICNKHADAMDNYPEPVVLPREQSDEESAKTLSEVLPVILEYNDYEQTYSDNWWEKLKHGTAAYGVFWNPEKENGVGDVDIRAIDLLKIFWEPGVTDIQDSKNLFVVELVDEETLDAQYPEYAGKMRGNAIDVKQYIYDDTVDTSEKSVVVDWYYKVKTPGGATALHYAKFVGDVLLYASQNDPEYAQTGFYSDGQYPVVLDVLYPEKGTPAGFGYVSICKDPQIYIDSLSGNILENAMMTTKKRFFVSSSTNINEDELMDWKKPVVRVEGTLDDKRIQEIQLTPMSSIYYNVLQMKIEEMKETASNRDVSNGSTGSGVTAAAAIAALQEAGNKASRDMISASYRTHVKIAKMVIERIRQFYDEVRAFRVTAPNEQGYDFTTLSNAGLRDQAIGIDHATQEVLYRKPVFDLKIKAQKKNPFSRMEQNERAKELYAAGFFNPEQAQPALIALEMMDFEGIDKIKEQVAQGQTLLNIINQMSAQMEQLAAMVAITTGGNPATVQPSGSTSAPKQSTGGSGIADAVTKAQTPMTDYGTRLAQRSKPDMDSGSDAAAVTR